MANRFWEQHSVEDHVKSPDKIVCEAGELKTLLNTIVTQLADADRRHTTALGQMQDRLSAMTEDARSLKSRAPDHFSSTFDRIEAGMAELSAKIAETGDAAPLAPQTATPAPAKSPEATTKPAMMSSGPAEAPVALRSAADYVPATQQRHYANVDTFDVIESSMPRDDHEPWDQDAADALASVYGNSGYNEGHKRATSIPASAMVADQVAMSAAKTPPGAAAYAAPMMASMPSDTGWLESRFADLSRQLDLSLAQIKPAAGEFEIGQRIESAERNISGLLETVATRTDVEGVRLIEAHVGELVDHLDHAQRQLGRLDAIEANLSDLSAKLEDVRTAIHKIGGAVSATGGDLELMASKAASAVAQRFTDAMPRAGALDGEVRTLIERHMSETRQGEENTVALLDTLQQAMIRLLDRVDAMELAQSQAIEHAAQSQAMAAREAMERSETFGRRAEHDRDMPVGRANDMLDAAVAAVATTRPKPTAQAPMQTQIQGHAMAPIDLASPPNTVMMQTPNPGEDEQTAMSSPEKLRQDFIADARRAKMRLANNTESSPEIMIAKGDDQAAAPMRATRGGSKPMAMSAADAPAAAAAASRFGMPAPRLIVLGLALLAVTSGVFWFGIGGGNPLGSPSGVIVKDLDSPAARKPTLEKVSGKNKKEARSESVPPAPNEQPAPSTDADPQADDGKLPKANSQQDIHGEIIPGDLTVGSTEVTTHGVAVETVDNASYGDVERAQRQPTLALDSNKLGQIVGNTLSPEPAALVPGSDASGLPGQPGNGLTSIGKNGFGHTSQLDLPPATVGPLSLRLAAANGDPSAQFQVGSRLAEGKGNELNFSEAAKWYQRSASTGFAQAQYRLGTLYERGLGLKADTAKAREWYTKAAELGNVKAMHNLAVLSANQRGSSPDYATAAKWFGEAANRGLSDSQFNLAILYENGLGVSQDLKAAYKWLELAARGGDAEAIRRRDILKGKMTAEDLAAAETSIKAWKVKQVDPLINDARTAGEAWKKNPANGVSG